MISRRQVGNMSGKRDIDTEGAVEIMQWDRPAESEVPGDALALALGIRAAVDAANKWAMKFVIERSLRFTEAATGKTLRQFLVDHGDGLREGEVVDLLAGRAVQGPGGTEYKLVPVDAAEDKFIGERMEPVLCELMRAIDDEDRPFSDWEFDMWLEAALA